jgi:hypothetical protein
MLARALESAVLIQAALSWLDDLDGLVAGGAAALRADIRDMPASGQGLGLAEIARGALVHRIRMEKRRIVSHDSLVPSLWNFSPRDASGARGPLEQALLGTPVADPGRPLEICARARLRPLQTPVSAGRGAGRMVRSPPNRRSEGRRDGRHRTFSPRWRETGQETLFRKADAVRAKHCGNLAQLRGVVHFSNHSARRPLLRLRKSIGEHPVA